MIAEVTRERRMPPWHASPEHGKFANANRLSEDELDLIERWVAAGAPHGDPQKQPAQPIFQTGWQLPKAPDKVVYMSEQPFLVKATGEVRYQYFTADPGLKEDIRKTLLARIDEARSKEYAEKPERVLRYAKVIVNGDLITGSSYDEYETGDGKFYNLQLQLNEEGRLRLWQYTKRRVGGNLLVVCNGVGIAAPRIRHELPMSSVTVNMIREKRLVKEAVDILISRNTEPAKIP